MPDEIDELCETLLEPKPDLEGLRAEAARKLSEFLLDIRGFNALYSICAYPDKYALEEGLLPIAAESIAKIISTRDLADKSAREYHEMKPKYVDGFHPEALKTVLAFLTEEQRKRIYDYVLENILCSAILTIYFYRHAVRSAVSLFLNNDYRCKMEAANATKLAKRFPERARNLELYFNGIVMRMITGEAFTTILPMFQGVFDNYAKFSPPDSDFEKYQRLHMIVLAKLACSEYSRLQEFFLAIGEMISLKYPEDAAYFEILKLMVKGEQQNANLAAEDLKRKLKISEDQRDQEQSDFSKLLLVAVGWLIKQWLSYRRG